MAYVITDTCTKDKLCIDACPVDCIHPKEDEAGFADVPHLYVNPRTASIAARAFRFARPIPSTRWKICRRNWRVSRKPTPLTTTDPGRAGHARPLGTSRPLWGRGTPRRRAARQIPIVIAIFPAQSHASPGASWKTGIIALFRFQGVRALGRRRPLVGSGVIAAARSHRWAPRRIHRDLDRAIGAVHGGVARRVLDGVLAADVARHVRGNAIDLVQFLGEKSLAAGRPMPVPPVPAWRARLPAALPRSTGPPRKSALRSVARPSPGSPG